VPSGQGLRQEAARPGLGDNAFTVVENFERAI
jgi:hypothetical protein